MNLEAIKQELNLIGAIIELLDNSILTVSDTAIGTNDSQLGHTENFIE